jgi:DNA (cytosine-5)-methyltransferase 1
VLLAEPTTNASDITKIPDEVFAGYRGMVDVIFAGFPCQGVSNAGKKKATDPRNQMFRQFVRATKEIQPRYVIGENVTGLLTMKSGLAESDPLLFDVIREEFKKIGYELTHKELEGTQFGVPQKRKRVLIVGWRLGEEFTPTSFWPKVTSWGSQQIMPMMRSFVKPSLADAHPLTGDEIPEGFRDYALEAVGEVSGSPHAFVALKGREKLLSCSKRVSPVHSEVVDLTKPSKTIICTYDHQPRLLVGLKRNTDCWVRTFTPDELKQIQGFPASFILRGNKKEQIVQAGNAVPPALVEAVARALFQSN